MPAARSARTRARRCATSPTSSTADAFGMVDGEALHDHAAHRQAHHVRTLDAGRVEHRYRVARHVGQRVVTPSSFDESPVSRLSKRTTWKPWAANFSHHGVGVVDALRAQAVDEQQRRVRGRAERLVVELDVTGSSSSAWQLGDSAAVTLLYERRIGYTAGRAREEDDQADDRRNRRSALAEYTAKRDFAKTPEPAGGRCAEVGDRSPLRRAAPPGPRAALRLPARDGRRARELGDPEGPVARPEREAARRARRGPPDRVLRLRGRDPGRRVRRRRRDRLGLGHLRGRARPTTRWPGGRRRRTPRRPVRREAARPARADPARRRTGAARSSGSSSTSTTSTRSRAGTRSSSRSRCAAAAPTTRCGASPMRCGAATRRRRSRASTSRTTRADIAALDAARRTKATGSSTASRSQLTNLDKVLFPGRTKREKPLTKRDLIRYYAMVAPVMVPYLESRPLNMHRFPQRRRQARLLAQGGPVARARVDHPLAQRRRRRRRNRVVHRRRPARDARVARELRRGRAARVDVDDPRTCASRRTR